MKTAPFYFSGKYKQLSGPAKGIKHAISFSKKIYLMGNFSYILS